MRESANITIQSTGAPCEIGKDLCIPVDGVEVSNGEWSFELRRCGELICPNYRRPLEKALEDTDYSGEVSVQDIELDLDEPIEFCIEGKSIRKRNIPIDCGLCIIVNQEEPEPYLPYPATYTYNICLSKAAFRPSDELRGAYRDAWDKWEELADERDTGEGEYLWRENFELYDQHKMYDNHGWLKKSTEGRQDSRKSANNTKGPFAKEFRK